jgi:hypothetical protein
MTFILRRARYGIKRRERQELRIAPRFLVQPLCGFGGAAVEESTAGERFRGIIFRK